MAKKELLFYVKLPVLLLVLTLFYSVTALGETGGNMSEMSKSKTNSESVNENRNRNEIRSENTSFNFKAEDLERARELTARSRQMTYQEIEKKWLELQNKLGNTKSKNKGSASCNSSNNKSGNNNLNNSLNNTLSSVTPTSREWGTFFRIFVSSSMSKNLLQAYAIAAKDYGAVLVFNGLPDGSWRELSKLVTEISGDAPEHVAMQIDDGAFAKFGITEVPSFVLSKEEDMFAVNPITTFDKVSGSISIRSALEMFASSGQLKDLASSNLEEHRGRND